MFYLLYQVLAQNVHYLEKDGKIKRITTNNCMTKCKMDMIKQIPHSFKDKNKKLTFISCNGLSPLQQTDIKLKDIYPTLNLL